MNGSPTDPLSCHYCYDRVITPESGPRLNNRGISEISLASYGAINQCYEDYEYNKYSPDSDLYAEQSISSAHRGILSLESRILRPYSAILKFLGMRAFRGEYIVHKVVSVLWPLVLFACLIIGYVINYKVCQHDEPSDIHKHETKSHEKFKKICYNVTIPYIYMDSVCDNTLDSIIPSVLHFIAFFVTFWNFRVKRSEQVEALVQKCFVTSFFGTNTTTHKRQLNRCLKVYSLYGILSLVGLLFMTLLNSYFGKTFVLSECLQNYNFNAVEKYFMGIGYAIPMFLMHVTYFPILINYIMQSRLIGFLINELRELLREKRTTLKVIMQEAHDTSTFIHKLNYESSPATSLMIFYLFYGLFIDMRVIVTKTQGAGGLYSLWYYECKPEYNVQQCDTIKSVVTYGRISLLCMAVKHTILLTLVLLVLVEGCRVNMHFRQLVNQAMETRVFGFKTACFHELDSFHYYIKSLRMRAKLFQFPLEAKRLVFPCVLMIYVGLCVLMSFE